MIVRTLWVTRNYGDPAPELLEAWDQFAIDENFQGWSEACDKALASIGSELGEYRYIDIQVQGIDEAFLRPVLEGQIDYRDHLSPASK